MSDYIIDVLTYEWVRNVSISFSVMVVILLLCKFFTSSTHELIVKLLSFVLLIFTLISLVESVVNDKWNIQTHLPLQLCGISQYIACFIAFVPRKKLLFEFLFYCGIAGGLVSILTPQITHYDGSMYAYWEYFVSHSLIILIPTYLLMFTEYSLTQFSWLRVFLLLNLLMALIMPLNFLLDSNYMYLNAPPEVDNPLIIGEWPFYLIYLEFFVAAIFYIIYIIFSLKNKRWG
jgi:hypothetical integral membrane protein (TIGR02206 family)